jgi:hypothetical protein
MPRKPSPAVQDRLLIQLSGYRHTRVVGVGGERPIDPAGLQSGPAVT